MNKRKQVLVGKNVYFAFFIIFLTLNHLAEARVGVGVKTKSLPAFPGAEGYGAYSIGGKGGRVIKITNLNSSGSGSLADACGKEGPRIVVFDVSGVIEGNVDITHPYITIAGQTAPGAGITIAGCLRNPYIGYTAKSIVHDVVIRFLRVRPPNARGSSFESDAVQLTNVYNLILDHISSSWSCDEALDLAASTNVTVQWCTVEEGALEGHPKGPHNLGPMFAYGSHSISVHHTLIAHNRQRNPLIRTVTPFDLRNTIVYNHWEGARVEWDRQDTTIGGATISPGEIRGNLIGNFYKTGPNSITGKGHPFAFAIGGGKFYFKDNCVDRIVFDNPIEAARGGIPHIGYRIDEASEDMLLNEPVDVPPVTTHPVLAAYDLVLDKAGCFPRDVVTKRIVQEVREGTGSWGKDIPDDLMQGLTPIDPPEDNDNDGMPDEWEDEHNLDKYDPSDASQIMVSGYTAIEEYINEIANNLIEQSSSSMRELDFSTPTKFSLQQNYPNPFNDSTIISYCVPESSSHLSSSNRHYTRLNIYNISGQLIRTLINEEKKTGYYQITWNGRNNNGQSVGSGVYFCRLEAGGQIVRQKLVLLR